MADTAAEAATPQITHLGHLHLMLQQCNVQPSSLQGLRGMQVSRQFFRRSIRGQLWCGKHKAGQQHPPRTAL